MLHRLCFFGEHSHKNGYILSRTLEISILEPSLMQILYHYCTVESFFAILRNKSIWLSNVNSMNDYHENIWADKFVISELRKLIEVVGQEPVDIAWEMYQRSKLNPFIFCLSSDPDVLSQWRGYASDGAGVAIGINANSLTENRHRPMHNIMKGMSLTLNEVVYNEEQQAKIITDFFNSDLINPIRSGALHPNNLHVSVQQLTGYAATFKNPAFSQEKEWRLIHTPMLMGREGGGHATEVRGSDYELKQRVVNSEIRSYFELPLQENFLKEIWLGPKCRVSSLDLTLLLSQTGHINTPIYRSIASYR